MSGMTDRSIDAAKWRDWYSQSRWRKLRLRHLRAHPLCAMCEAEGFVEAATIVHHVKAHKGDLALFYDPANLQSVCKQHHDSALQAEEKSGVKWAPSPRVDGWAAYVPKR